jgi:uncharacterized protein
MTDVRVAYTKYDGSLHWNQTMRLLGEDEHGVWLGGPKGLIARRGHDDVVLEMPWAHVILFPRNAWWTAAFNGPEAPVDIYCDITTPALWPEPGEVTMVDLDLDVLRERDSRRVKLDDEDEFAEHQVRYAYPPDVIARASASAKFLLAAVAEGSGPFDGAHDRYLDQVL